VSGQSILAVLVNREDAISANERSFDYLCHRGDTVSAFDGVSDRCSRFDNREEAIAANERPIDGDADGDL